MKIQSISGYTFNRNINTNKHNKPFFYPNNLQQDTVSFGSNRFPYKILDRYLKFLEKQQKINEQTAKAIEFLHKKANICHKKINSKMTNLLKDGDFLWAITPPKAKSKYSIIAVNSTYIKKNTKVNQDEMWDQIYSYIRNHIFSSNPDDILKELELTEPLMKTENHKVLFSKLKALIMQKSSIKDQFAEKEKQLKYQNFTKITDIEIAQSKILLPSWSVEIRNQFYKEVANMAIKRDRLLKEIYSETHKKVLNTHKTLPGYNNTKAEKEATTQASFKVIQYLKFGNLENTLPF